MRDWHRIFGVSLADAVTGLPFRVVQELELSKIRQRLDVAIVRATEAGITHDWPDLPDGLTDLADHNLISYKSIRESLTPGAMLELHSHLVVYAKQEWKENWESTIRQPNTIRIYAVTTHRPRWLEGEVGNHSIRPGVYEIKFLEFATRLIVPREVEKAPRNALWHLLSGDAARVQYGMEHYQMHDLALYNIMNELKASYSLEGLEMPYTIDDYKREVAQELWEKMSPEERRELFDKMSPEERRELFDKLSPEERRELFDKMSPEERREFFENTSLEERLAGFSAQEIQAYLKRLEDNADSPNGDEQD